MHACVAKQIQRLGPRLRDNDRMAETREKPLERCPRLFMILNQKNVHILYSQQPPSHVGVGAKVESSGIEKALSIVSQGCRVNGDSSLTRHARPG